MTQLLPVAIIVLCASVDQTCAVIHRLFGGSLQQPYQQQQQGYVQQQAIQPPQDIQQQVNFPTAVQFGAVASPQANSICEDGESDDAVTLQNILNDCCSKYTSVQADNMFTCLYDKKLFSPASMNDARDRLPFSCSPEAFIYSLCTSQENYEQMYCALTQAQRTRYSEFSLEDKKTIVKDCADQNLGTCSDNSNLV